MISPIGSAATNAVSGILRSQGRVAQDAATVAGATLPRQDDGSAAKGAGSTSGTKLDNPAGSLLAGGLSTQEDGGVSALTDLISAKTAYKANAAVLKVAEKLSRETLDIAT